LPAAATVTYGGARAARDRVLDVDDAHVRARRVRLCGDDLVSERRPKSKARQQLGKQVASRLERDERGKFLPSEPAVAGDEPATARRKRAAPVETPASPVDEPATPAAAGHGTVQYRQPKRRREQAKDGASRTGKRTGAKRARPAAAPATPAREPRTRAPAAKKEPGLLESFKAGLLGR